jgi:hypothetical protein
MAGSFKKYGFKTQAEKVYQWSALLARGTPEGIRLFENYSWMA